MAYERKMWVNKGMSGAIPLSPDNLNRMEDGIEEALSRVDVGVVTVTEGITKVNLGYKPRYLTLLGNGDSTPITLFQNTTNTLCTLTDNGFEIFGGLIITDTNISDYFTVTNGNYYFQWNSNSFASNNNLKGLNSTTATTTLKAKLDMNIIFTYGFSSEANYDKFYITIGGKKILDGGSGATTNYIYNGIVKKNEIIEFKYSKDGSNDKNLDHAWFTDMRVNGVALGDCSYMVIK